MSITFGPGIGKGPLNTPPDLLPDTTLNDRAPAVIQAVPGQVGNLLEFRDPSGAVLSFWDINGVAGGAASLAGAVILAPATTARNIVRPTVNNAVNLSLKAFAGQTVDVFETLDSAGVLTGGVSPGGSWRFKGLALGAKIVTGNYTVLGTDFYLAVDATAGPVTITLPAANALTPFGREVCITKTDATVNLVTIVPTGADTFILGGAAVILVNPVDEVICQSDGISVWSALYGNTFRNFDGSMLVQPAPGAPGSFIVEILDPIAPGGARDVFTIGQSGGGTTVEIRAGKDSDKALVVRPRSATQTAPVLEVLGATGTLLDVGPNGIGFFAAAPVVKQTGASAAGIAAITDANAKAAVSAHQTALANLGLITSPA